MTKTVSNMIESVRTVVGDVSVGSSSKPATRSVIGGDVLVAPAASRLSSLPNYQFHRHRHCHADAGLLWGHRRALIGNAASLGFMAAAVGLTVRRGKVLGFRNLFHSVSAPKDIVYIGALYGAGDISQQLITQSRRTLGTPVERRKWDFSVDWPGAASAGLVGGTVIGTFNHYWYTFLDKLIRGTTFRSVAKKVLLDQMSLPIPIAAFFIAMAVVKAKPDVFEELKTKFMTTYLYGTALWTTMNFFNFMFVPRFHRILFIGCVEFLWTNVMCFMVDLEIEKDDPLSRLDPLSLD